MQLEAISFRPISSYLGETTNTHLTATSSQVDVESHKVSHQTPPDYSPSSLSRSS